MDVNSPVAKRIAAFGDLEGIDSYVLIVPSGRKDALILSEKAKVIPSGGSNKLTRLIGMKIRAFKELRSNSYQVLTVQDAYYVGLLAWCLAKFFNVGLEIQVHGFEKFSGLRKAIAEFVLPRAAAVRVVSARLEKILVDEFNVSPDNITEVPICNEIKIEADGVRSDYSESLEGRFVFFTASRLVAVKNISLQLQAMAEVAKKYPRAELRIAGDGPDFDQLKREADKLKANAVFLKWLDASALAREFKAADAFLLTSDSEGWALSAVEAGAHALPIIMTDVGLAGEVIKDEESGLIIPINDREKLILSMKRIIDDHDLRRRLGQGALEAVRKLPKHKETLELYMRSWQRAAHKIRKLLILTQKVDINDDYLGFFHGWIKEFAGHYDLITVICLQKGEFDLPNNVRVFSLGKEEKLSRWKYALNFYRYIWSFRKEYDAVFIHMNPEYAVLGGCCWKLWGKPVALWFVHKSVNWKLRVAEKFSKIIFTSARESFNLPSRKVAYLGHGIDTASYSRIERQPQPQRNGPINLLYVGRISPIKDQELLIRAADILVNQKNQDIKVIFVGGAVYPQDERYLAGLKRLVGELKLENNIEFAGSVPNRLIAQYYQKAGISINLCPTGGIDKAVLESLASGVLAIAFNKAFKNLLDGYPQLMLENREPEELADKIANLISLTAEEYAKISSDLKKRVVDDYSLSRIIAEIAAGIAGDKQILCP